MVRPYNSLLSIIQRTFEVLLVWVSLVLSVHLYDRDWSHSYGVAAACGMAAYYLAATTLDTYRSWRGQSVLLEIWQVGKCWIAVIFTLLLISFVTRSEHLYSRLVITTWWVLAFGAHVGFRMGLRVTLRYARAAGFNSRSAIIAGAGPVGIAVARQITGNPSMGVRLIGFYDDHLPIGTRPAEDLPLEVIGPLDNLAVDAHMQGYDIVYFALPMGAEIRAKAIINTLTRSATEVQYIPDIFVFNLINARIRDLGGIPTISLFESPLDSFGKLTKRIEDMVIGSLILCLIAIPMIAIAIGIKLTSPGPVLFKQRRYGLNGQEIKVWKFRSMSVCEDDGHVAQATSDDPRVTPFGRFLRSTSLDELPQFFNVLLGSMSIVGPRPHAVIHNEQYRELIDQYMLRHLVKPGITGWAQIHGWRGETDTLEKMEQRVKYDMEYIRHWSLSLDLKIILLTVLRGFTDKNAY